MAALTKVLTDPFAWLVMYGAAGLGWAFYYGIPPAVAGWVILRAEAASPEDRGAAGTDRPLGHGSQRHRRGGQGRVASGFRLTRMLLPDCSYCARRCSIAAFLMFFWSFSKARTSIWRTRSRLMP